MPSMSRATARASSILSLFSLLVQMYENRKRHVFPFPSLAVERGMFTRPRVGVVEGRVQDLQDADALVLGLLRTCLHEKRPRNWHAVVGSGGGWGDPVKVV